jgi:hypothetical protein
MYYVDDLLVCDATRSAIDLFKTEISAKYQMKDLGRLQWLLGMKVESDGSGGIIISQGAYIRSIIEKYGMTKEKMATTPAIPGVQLTAEIANTDANAISDFPYREAVGALMYAATCTRPDIACAVGRVARYVSKPTAAHVAAVRRIFGYLRRFPDLGLHMHGNNDGAVPPTLSAYADSDWAGDTADWKSTGGYLIMIGNSLVNWSSRKMKGIMTSTAAAEAAAATAATMDIVWCRLVMAELGSPQLDATIIHEDNEACIAMVRNPIISERSKHIALKIAYIREQHQEKTIVMTRCPTSEQGADILTKALSPLPFNHLRDDIIAMAASPSGAIDDITTIENENEAQDTMGMRSPPSAHFGFSPSLEPGPSVLGAVGAGPLGSVPRVGPVATASTLVTRAPILGSGNDACHAR